MKHIKKINENKKPKRFTYSCVGYGVFSLLGEFYRMGRIEVFDNENGSGYAVHEGFYCMPFKEARKFEDMIDDMATDFPIHFDMGSMDWCQNIVSEHLGIPKDKLNDAETKKKYFRDKYISEHGYTPEEGTEKLKKELDKANREAIVKKDTK